MKKPLKKPWAWGKFEGSAAGLKWNRRDLANLEYVLAMTPGRKLAIQAGGNLGIFAKRLAEEFETVLTFEPDPENFAILCRNAPEPNIFKIQAALSFCRERVAVSHKRRDGKPAKHEGTYHVDGPGRVPAVRIDDFVSDACDLIYLDVEGYELRALKGAFNTLALHPSRPVVACEINRSLGLAGDSEELLNSYMANCDYERCGAANSDVIWRKRPRMGQRT